MRRIAVLCNPRSGNVASGSGEALDRRLTDLLKRHGSVPELRSFDPATVREDVRTLLSGDPDAVLAVGGDGTVVGVAEQLVGSDVPLGVVPGGTINLLARDLGVPGELDAAVDALLSAPSRRIDVGRVNGRIFLCSSALAMLPHLGRVRERARGTRGRQLLRALARGARILRRYPSTRVGITVDGREHVVLTRAMIVSNNPLVPGSLGRPEREFLDTGRLAVYVSGGSTHWDVVGIAARLVDGSWQDAKRLLTYEGHSLEITMTPPGLVTVMNDGELIQMEPPLRYEIQPKALTVLAPGSAGDGS